MARHDSYSCSEFNRLNRRQFLGATAGVASAASLPAWFPSLAFADPPTFNPCDKTLIEIFLRGGADGLSMVIPHGDSKLYDATLDANNLPLYRPQGSPLYVQEPDSSGPGCASCIDHEMQVCKRAIDLDGFFGLAPALCKLKDIWDEGQLCIATGVALPQQSYSHFAAQVWMESCMPTPQPSDDVRGYMVRFLETIGGQVCVPTLRGLGVGSALNRGLAGGQRTLAIPNPADFRLGGIGATSGDRLEYLNQMYSHDLYPGFADVSNVIVDSIATLGGVNFSNIRNYGNTSLGKAMNAVASIVKADVGLQVAQIDSGSWDFHSEQNPNTVQENSGMWRQMWTLGQAMRAFWEDLTQANCLDRVVVVVRTEFGRTVAANGSKGTDHGHGSVMFLMGGRVNGGNVVSSDPWPGLENLHAPGSQQPGCTGDRDICLLTDPRLLLAEVFDRFLSNNAGLAHIFPGYTVPQPYLGCIST